MFIARIGKYDTLFAGRIYCRALEFINCKINQSSPELKINWVNFIIVNSAVTIKLCAFNVHIRKGTISHLLSFHWLESSSKKYQSISLNVFWFSSLLGPLPNVSQVGLIPKNVTRNTEYNMD